MFILRATFSQLIHVLYELMKMKIQGNWGRFLFLFFYYQKYIFYFFLITIIVFFSNFADIYIDIR